MSQKSNHFTTHIHTKLHEFLINSFLVTACTNRQRDTQTDNTENNTILCYFAGQVMTL